MKTRYFILLLFLIHSFAGNAQESKTRTREDFCRDLKSYIDAYNVKSEAAKGKTLYESFEPMFMSDSFTASDREQVMAIGDKLMASRDQGSKVFNNICSFLDVLTSLSSSSIDKKSVTNWLTYTAGMMKSSRFKFDAYIERCGAFFNDGLLYEKGNVRWELRRASIELPSDTVLNFLIHKADLALLSKNDSSIVENTSGTFYFDSQKWHGEGGKVSWQRFDINADSLYVMLSTYDVTLSKTEYRADSALLFNKMYFSKPILCSFEDKVTNVAPSPKSAYPKIMSYDHDITLNDIFKNVNLKGGIGMSGLSINTFGDEEEKASMSLCFSGVVMGNFSSKRFVITDGALVSENAASSIYLYDTIDGHVYVDSVYHNGLGFRYDDTRRRLVLFRSEKGYGDSPFYDSYHEVEIYLEALYWHLDRELIEFRRLEGATTVSEGYLSSLNYFRKNDYAQLQSMDMIHPMVSIEGFLKRYGIGEHENEFYLDTYATYLQLSQDQTIGILLRLQSLGYLDYDRDTKYVRVKQRFFDVLSSQREEIDFDVIKIMTKTSNRKPNIILDMETNKLVVEGIYAPISGVDGSSIAVSDVKHVTILPDHGKVEMKKGRDFRFSGVIMAGLFEFYTQNSTFNYDSFYIDMPEIDSMKFFIFRDNTMLSIKGTLENLHGKLFIDKTDNKSSKVLTPEYPRFVSEGNAYKFYRNINGGVFDPGPTRDENGDFVVDGKFYYLLEPFVLDSLNDLVADNIYFDGKLVSGDIFPVISQPLRVMSDNSLGFEHQVVSETGFYPMYGGRGLYSNMIHLSEQGFVGEGQIRYCTSEFDSKEFVFYLDSVTSVVDNFVMKEEQNAIQYPKAHCSSLDFKWYVYEPSLVTRTLDEPICLYDTTYFTGETYLSPQGYRADGEVVFGLTNFESKHFDFNYSDFEADSADFMLYTQDRKQKAFLATNYKAIVDFANHKVSYNYLDAGSSLTFPFNQYICTLKEAEWDMNDNSIRVFSSSDNFSDYAKASSFDELLSLQSSGSKFISTHPEQDSLSFYCMDADYDMQSYSIHANEVKIIRVADAAIFPSDRKVDILADAALTPLTNTTIIADTTNRYHLFYDANVVINSKHDFYAQGTYNYVDALKNTTSLFFDTISPVSGSTRAKAVITDDQDFRLSSVFGFDGIMEICSDDRYAMFDGYYRMIESCNEHNYRFRSKTQINPENIEIPIDLSVIHDDNPLLLNGLYYDDWREGKYLLSFVNVPRSYENIQSISPLEGMLSYDANADKFIVATANDPLTYSELSNRCCITQHGMTDLGFSTGLVSLSCEGAVIHNTLNDSVAIDAAIAVNFPIMDDRLWESIAKKLLESETEPLKLDQQKFYNYLRRDNPNLSRIEFLDELSMKGYPTVRNNEALNRSLVMTDIKMVWNNDLKAFVSVGPIGIGNLGRSVVSKNVEGNVVFNKARGVLTFFFRIGGDMVYMSYDCYDKQLQIHTTFGDINSRLSDMKEKNRTISRGDVSFNYVVTPFEAITRFLNEIRRAGVE